MTENDAEYFYIPRVDEIREAWADKHWDPYGDIEWSYYAEQFDAWFDSLRLVPSAS